jgi:hypothetical protein
MGSYEATRARGRVAAAWDQAWRPLPTAGAECSGRTMALSILMKFYQFYHKFISAAGERAGTGGEFRRDLWLIAVLIGWLELGPDQPPDLRGLAM